MQNLDSHVCTFHFICRCHAANVNISYLMKSDRELQTLEVLRSVFSDRWFGRLRNILSCLEQNRFVFIRIPLSFIYQYDICHAWF